MRTCTHATHAIEVSDAGHIMKPTVEAIESPRRRPHAINISNYTSGNITRDANFAVDLIV